MCKSVYVRLCVPVFVTNCDNVVWLCPCCVYVVVVLVSRCVFVCVCVSVLKVVCVCVSKGVLVYNSYTPHTHTIRNTRNSRTLHAHHTHPHGSCVSFCDLSCCAARWQTTTDTHNTTTHHHHTQTHHNTRTLPSMTHDTHTQHSFS